MDHVGTLNGSCTGTPEMTYDAFGNLTQKDGLAYTYGGTAGPHAVTQVGSTTYTYDANGNMTGGDGRVLTYSVFDQMTKATQGGNTLEFAYGIDRQRYRRSETVGGTTRHTYYRGNAELVDSGTGTDEIRRRIGGEVLVVHAMNADGSIQSTDRRYQMLDHLGSPIAVYDDNGAPLERLSYGSWGERRDYYSATLATLPHYNTTFVSVTARGYTGHEHGDAFGLIDQRVTLPRKH